MAGGFQLPSRRAWSGQYARRQIEKSWLYCCCTTVKIERAINISPLRVPPVSFAVTLNITVPFPLPLAPLDTVIQVAPLTAVHGHPTCVITEIGPADPPDFTTV